MEIRELIIDGSPIYYYINIGRTDNSRRWTATVQYKGHRRLVQQTPLATGPSSLKTLNDLADATVKEIHRELNLDQ